MAFPFQGRDTTVVTTLPHMHTAVTLSHRRDSGGGGGGVRDCFVGSGDVLLHGLCVVVAAAREHDGQRAVPHDLNRGGGCEMCGVVWCGVVWCNVSRCMKSWVYVCVCVSVCVSESVRMVPRAWCWAQPRLPNHPTHPAALRTPPTLTFHRMPIS